MNRLAHPRRRVLAAPRADVVRMAACAWTLVGRVARALADGQTDDATACMRALTWLAGALPEAVPGRVRAQVLQGPQVASEVAQTVSLAVLREVCGHTGAAAEGLQAGLLSRTAAVRRSALDDLAVALPWVRLDASAWAPVLLELVRLDSALALEALVLVLWAIPALADRDELLQTLVRRTARLADAPPIVRLGQGLPVAHAHTHVLGQTLLQLTAALTAVPDEPTGQLRLDGLLGQPSFDPHHNRTVLYGGQPPPALTVARVLERLREHPLWAPTLHPLEGLVEAGQLGADLPIPPRATA